MVFCRFALQQGRAPLAGGCCRLAAFAPRPALRRSVLPTKLNPPQAKALTLKQAVLVAGGRPPAPPAGSAVRWRGGCLPHLWFRA